MTEPEQCVAVLWMRNHVHLPAAPAPVRLQMVLLLALLLPALAFRVLPVNYGSPEPGYFSSDEIDAVSRALKMASGDLLPLHANKPTLYNEILAGVYGVQFLTGKLLHGVGRAEFEQAFFLKPFPFYRAARVVSITASCASLLLLLLMLREHGRYAQIVGLLLLGYGKSSVYYGHVGKEDALAAFLVLAAAYCALRSRKSQTQGGRPANEQRWILAAAAAAGLAVSAKYNCVFAILFPLIALLQARKSTRNFIPTTILTAACFMVGFFLGTPYAMLHPWEFIVRTLNSTVASQVAGSFNILSYADNRGLLYVGRILFADMGIGGIAVLCAAVTAVIRRQSEHIIVGIPCMVYLLILTVSGQLDYQYAIILTPLAAWLVGHELTDSRNNRISGVLAIGALVAGMTVHFYLLTKKTSEFLGGDTRLYAAQWVEKHLAATGSHKPILIVSGFYFHYYPALHFDESTYMSLHEQATKAGGTGNYFQKAAHYAKLDNRPLVTAEFLDIKTGFRRNSDGTRSFEPQPFPLAMEAFRDRHSMVIIPSNTMQILQAEAPELADLKALISSFSALPLPAEFKPIAWKRAGPTISIYAAP